MLNETASDVLLLPWSPRRRKSLRTISKNASKAAVHPEMELLKTKAENDRLGARIAVLEAQLAKADSVLSRAVTEAFDGCRKTLGANGRQRLSA